MDPIKYNFGVRARKDDPSVRSLWDWSKPYNSGLIRRRVTTVIYMYITYPKKV